MRRAYQRGYLMTPPAPRAFARITFRQTTAFRTMHTAVIPTLVQAGISYQIKPHARAALTAESAAEERGVRVSQIVKCMVGRADSAIIVMLLPGDCRLKSSKARKHVRATSLDLLPRDVLENDLRLIIGAISPVQLLGHARMLMDPLVLEEEMVAISSGDPMSGIELRSADLHELLQAELVSITSTVHQR